MLLRLLIAAFLLGTFLHGLPVRGAEPWLAGSAMTAALDEPCVAIFKDKPVRETLRDLGEQLRIGMILDRRADPHRPVTLGDDRLTVKEALESLAAQTQLTLSLTGSVAVLGPPETTRLLKTMAELRRNELSSVPPKRRGELSRPREITWTDLSEPSEVLTRIARPAGLRVLNPERLPHDLLWGQSLPHSSTTELLSVFLVQFGLTFEWEDQTSAVRLIPFPASAAVEREHTLPAAKRAEVLQEIQKRWSELAVADEPGRIRFAARVEQHEQVAEWIRPTPARPDRPKPRATDWAQKRLTLRVVQTPAAEVLKNLEVTGLSFEVAPGVKIDTRLSFELKNATLDAVVAEIARQLDASAERTEATVVLMPLQRGSP